MKGLLYIISINRYINRFTYHRWKQLPCWLCTPF